MDAEWLIAELEDFLSRYETTMDKHSVYEASADDARRWVEDMLPLVSGRLFIDKKEIMT